MGLQWYLAMYENELALCPHPPAPMAWLGCTFSGSGGGISHLPPRLPAGTLLVFSDLIPFDGHDVQKIAAQLDGPWAGILLDLQRQADYRALIESVCRQVHCPVAVTEMHAKNQDCAVFLSPPLNIPLQTAAKPWAGRKLWADGAVGVQHFTLTETGCQVSDILPPDGREYPEMTHVFCRLRKDKGKDFLRYSLYRDVDALKEWMQSAQALGIETVVSLYGEIKRNNP